ncbi:hypothetical protein KSP39_PZI019995 [Platanthera zijinensis]|uniref:DUF4743 domain-containing protein n=1 Tax=Platanthera zijinensis TaxID=2320716 RepID=A0AAP0AZU4_9ASPA
MKCCKPARCSLVADSLRLAAPVTTGFGWDDVAQEAEREDDDPSDLGGYFQKILNCNRGSELRSQFVPFVIEDEAVGHIHECFVHHLIKFEDVFTLSLDKARCADSRHVTLHPSLKTPDIRTRAVADVIKCLGDHIPGIRNELYPVTSAFGKRTYFSLERAAAPYFGIKVESKNVCLLTPKIL